MVGGRHARALPQQSDANVVAVDDPGQERPAGRRSGAGERRRPDRATARPADAGHGDPLRRAVLHGVKGASERLSRGARQRREGSRSATHRDQSRGRQRLLRGRVARWEAVGLLLAVAARSRDPGPGHRQRARIPADSGDQLPAVHGTAVVSGRPIGDGARQRSAARRKPPVSRRSRHWTRGTAADQRRNPCIPISRQTDAGS